MSSSIHQVMIMMSSELLSSQVPHRQPLLLPEGEATSPRATVEARVPGLSASYPMSHLPVELRLFPWDYTILVPETHVK